MFQAGAAGEPHLGITERDMEGRNHGPACSLHTQSSFRGGQPSGQDREASLRCHEEGRGAAGLQFFNIFIWLQWGLSLQHAGSNSLTDGSRGSCNGSPEPLDHQGSHLFWRREGGLTPDSSGPLSHFPGWRSGQRSNGNRPAPSAFLLMRNAQRVGGLP